MPLNDGVETRGRDFKKIGPVSAPLFIIAMRCRAWVDTGGPSAPRIVPTSTAIPTAATVDGGERDAEPFAMSRKSDPNLKLENAGFSHQQFHDRRPPLNVHHTHCSLAIHSRTRADTHSVASLCDL